MNISNIIDHGIFFYDGIIENNAKDIVLMIAAVLASMIIPYLLGSLNFAIIISSKEYKQDIRSYGSKNAGMTNMMRTYGKKAAGLTLLGDALKAIVSGVVGYVMLGYLGAFIAGLFCVIGHMFPIFYKFRGGKGVVTAAISMLMCDPISFAIILLIFIIIVAFTKYISLGSIMCACLYPIVLDRVYKIIYGHTCPFTWIAFLMAALVVIKHWENIKRLKDGKENKFSFKKSKKASDVSDAEAIVPELPESENDIEDEGSEVHVTKKKKLNKNYGKKKK